MKQIICSSAGAKVIRTPRPGLPAGWVLVRTRYSMISIGTEIAALRPPQPVEQTTVEQLSEKSRLLAHYLGKAARNPRKAAHKAIELALKKARPLFARLQAQSKVEVVSGPLQWEIADTAKGQSGGKLALTLSSGPGSGYQAWVGPVAVPEGKFPIIKFKGELKHSSLAVGILDTASDTWVLSNVYSPGEINDEFAACDLSAAFKIIISGVDAGKAFELALSELEIGFADKEAAALWRNEMDDQGWGVGYSASGEIMACGAGVTDLSVGQAVACCGAGWASHAEYIALPRNMVCPVPQGCTLAQAASTTIGSIALQGVRRASPALGEKAIVLGLGVIGQITVQLLRASGCTVLGFDLSPRRVGKALELGMDYGSSDAQEFAEFVKKATGTFGADKVLITAATKSNAPINQAMELVREKGTVIIVGDVGLAAERPKFYRKEVNLLMSTSYGAGRYDAEYEVQGKDYPYGYVRWTINRNMQAYMEQIVRGAVNIDSLFEKTVDLSNAPAVYEELAHSKEELPLGVLLVYPAEADESASIALRGAKLVSASAGQARAALVGVGAYGVSMLVPKMQALPEYFTLAGVVSSDVVRGGNYARQMRISHFSASAEAMAENPEIDLLVVASRHNQHALAVKAALKAGKSVFVEKPLVTTWEDLAALEAQYKELPSPPLLMVGFNRRFSPAIECLRQELAGRTDPLMILYRINAGFIPKEHWLQGIEGAGRNIGEACHMYDVFRCLAGAMVEEISAQAIMPESAARLRSDNFSATLRYGDGTQATLIYTASGPKTGMPKERMEVFCAGEAYVLDDFKSLTRASDGKVLWQGEVDKGHSREFELLGKALLEGGAAPIPIDEIFETTAVSLYVDDCIHGRIVE